MQVYLKEFYGALKKYEGSLIKVSAAKKLNKNAKEYLAKLAKQGIVEKAAWGWYYIKPAKDVSALEFLQQDQSFKVMVSQSAASFWNNDFVHREALNIVVDDMSLKKALETFAKNRGWQLTIEYKKGAHKLNFARIKKLIVERPDATIIDCIKNWAFVDAIAVLVVNKSKIDWRKLTTNSYWTRVSGTDIRVRQAIEYASYQLNKMTDTNFNARNITINNDFVKQELDEAIEKVLEFE
jgi:hypothetical protein